MTNALLYLPTLIPQWGIFAGAALLTLGYVEKKELWTRIGWIVLIATSIAALYFNLFGGLNTLSGKILPGSVASQLISTGWQTATGGVLAIASLLMFQLKKKRYPMIAILTIAYFILTFFLYTEISGSTGKLNGTDQKREQKQ
jgi:hypothetical protein